jgi:hypothetical protein
MIESASFDGVGREIGGYEGIQWVTKCPNVFKIIGLLLINPW